MENKNVRSNNNSNKRLATKEAMASRNSVSKIVTAKAGSRYTGGLGVVKNPNPSYNIRLPIATVTLTSTATPSLSNALNISAASVNNFATRWGTVFREYCIVAADLRIQSLAGTGGTAVAWLDELNGTAPSAATAGTADHVTFTLSTGNSTSSCRLLWKIAEINDSGFTDTLSVVPVPVILKVYSDTPNFGLTLANSALVTVDGFITVTFRGIK